MSIGARFARKNRHSRRNSQPVVPVIAADASQSRQKDKISRRTMSPCVGVHDRLYTSIAFSYLLFVVVTWRTLELDGTENALAPKIWTANVCFRGGVSNCQPMEERPVSNLEKIVRIKTVLARTGLSRSTLYRKIAEGTFPCQVKISVHGAGWRESAVNRWIADPIGYREEQLSQNS